MAPAKKPPLVVTEDSFVSVIRAFRASPKWSAYSDATRDLWGRELDLMARPRCLGALSRQEIRPSLVQRFFDGIADRPGKAAAGYAVLRQLEKWAIVRELLPRQILLGVEISSSDGGGHIPWSDEQVEIAEKHARPDLARAVTLAANTGQRGSDLIRMGPTDVETYQGIQGINVTQKKTGKQVWVPVTSPLRAAMATWERKPGPFLTRPDGRPWPRKALTQAWAYQRDTNTELAQHRNPPQRTADMAACDPDGLVLHGLRGTACVRLRRSGATIPQIADMVGMSEEMVARYCRFSVQRENAVAAVTHLERTFAERNFDKSNKNQA